jgi:hypothetical protein
MTSQMLSTMFTRIYRFFQDLHRIQKPRPHGQDLLLGVTTGTERREPVIFKEELRPTHLAIIGLSGVGKSYLIENLLRQDIKNGTGFVLFDVHGDLSDSVVAYLADRTLKHREIADKIILIEPFDPVATIGFNPLEQASSNSAHAQAQELANVLRVRWETKSFGPRSEELMRNALYTLSVNNLTLLELPALLTQASYREKLLERVADRTVLEYWRDRYGSLSDGMRVVVREPLLTRVSAFLADPQIREIVGQRQTTFSFGKAIREGQWVVVNLSKGKLGEENSAVLGSLLFTKLKLDVMAQAKVPASDRKLFAVYADELQNLVGSNVLELIAEARKYRISITTGQQFWEQLPSHMRTAVLGMGSRIFFRLHYHDAAELAGEIHPSRRPFYADKLSNLPNREAVFRTGVERPSEFVVQSHKTVSYDPESIERLRAHSRRLHGKGRVEIQAEFERRVKRGEDTSLDQELT